MRGSGLSRRDVLGAAVAVPAVGLERGQALSLPLLAQRAPPSPETGEGLRWARALERLADAEAAMRAAGELKGRSFEEQEGLDEAFSDRVVAFNRAVEHMLLVPAPDLRALAVKVALAVDEQAWELPRGDACMARLKRDSRRLCGAGDRAGR